MRFEPNQPFSSPLKTVTVDAGLGIGPHTFRLEVVNDRGVHSQPIDFVVQVVRLAPIPTPIPIPDPIPRPTPGPIPRPPIG